MLRTIVIIITAVIIGACVLSVAGCDTTSRERVAFVQRAIDAGLAEVEALDGAIAGLEADLAAAEATLAPGSGADDETSAKVREGIERTRALIAAAREKRTAIEASVLDWQSKLNAVAAGGDITLGDEIQLAGEAGKQVAAYVPAPFGAIVSLISGVVVAIGGVLAARERAKRAASDTAFAEVVRSVDVVLHDNPVSSGDMKALLKGAQSPGTRAKVLEVQAAAA